MCTVSYGKSGADCVRGTPPKIRSRDPCVNWDMRALPRAGILANRSGGSRSDLWDARRNTSQFGSIRSLYQSNRLDDAPYRSPSMGSIEILGRNRPSRAGVEDIFCVERRIRLGCAGRQPRFKPTQNTPDSLRQHQPST